MCSPAPQQGKIESAKIRVENIIRSDLSTELLEILELYCELLLARAGLLEARECDPGLEEAVQSVIYAAPRTEIKELQAARALLVDKYGKDFALAAVDDTAGKVAPRVRERLRVEPPPPELVQRYLEEIARTYGVDWPKGARRAEEEGEGEEAGGGQDGDDDDRPGGGEKVLADPAGKAKLEEPLTTEELSRATPPREVGGPKSPVHVAPPKSSTDNVSPRVRMPQPPELKPSSKMTNAARGAESSSGSGNGNQGQGAPAGKSGPVGGKIPDVDELAKRFAALKK